MNMPQTMHLSAAAGLGGDCSPANTGRAMSRSSREANNEMYFIGEYPFHGDGGLMKEYNKRMN
jgi:hypothetical protein